MRTTSVILGLVLLCSGLLADIDITNPALVSRLRDPDKQALEEHGMAAHTTDFDQIYELYEQAADEDLPVLVTTDPLLHVFHILYDYSLRVAELEHFSPAVQAMLSALVDHQLGLSEQASSPAVREAAEANVAFLSVPLSFLDTRYSIPPEVEKQVLAERTLIDSAAGFDTSKVMLVLEDFSQYKPRGHYTRSQEFERYFKAMMYLGRMTFKLSIPEHEALAVRHTRQAVLLSDALASAQTETGRTASELWSSVYDPTAYMVGESEDPLPQDYFRLASEMAAGKPLNEWVALDSNIRLFIPAAETLSSPSIVSTYLRDIDDPVQTEGMRLMSQRYIPDSYMFQNLVYTKVGTQDLPRTLPMGLDVLAVLGSERGRKLVVELYEQDQYENYLTQLDKLTEEFGQLTEEDWNRNAYYGWLFALKLNLEPVPFPRRHPLVARFTQSEAYPDKTLMTSGGSWAELRHDTILYAKQSYTMAATAMPYEPEKPPPDIAYVEPKPAVFEQLARLSSGLLDRLKGLSNNQVRARLEEFGSVNTHLARIAQDELEGRNMSPTDAALCKGIGLRLKDLTTWERVNEEAEDYWERYQNDEDDRMAVIADVHTDVNKSEVLEEAVGNPLMLYAVVPFQGRDFLAVGGMFSWYEFTRPMDERMTDAEWQELETKPDLPAWSSSFVTR